MTKTTDRGIVADGVRVLEPMRDRLGCWTEDPSIFSIVRYTVLDSVLACVTLCRKQKVKWCCTALNDPLFPYCCRRWELFFWPTNPCMNVSRG